MSLNPGDRTSWRRRYSSGDLTLIAAGIALALICALFPWYIFYNQDQFGIRALKFESGADAGASGGAGLDPRSRISPEPMELQEIAPSPEELDTLATGGVPADVAPRTAVPGIEKQPFPSPQGEFRLIHVANGRAMIEDERGLWIVQPGSILPDDSRVASIEQRAGRWVLVTNADRVVPIAD